MKKLLSIILAVVFFCSCFSVASNAAALKKLDLAFVVDTTGSMSDDIRRVKADMRQYLDDLKESGMNYRVAIIDYRDFPERSESGDYPYRVQIDFSTDYDTIIAGIEALTLGSGGDWRETIYSALIDGVNELSWRSDAGKAVILMGDAPALDPEPYTNYTADDAINSLNTGSIAKEDHMRPDGFLSTDQVYEPMATKRSAITLFAIATDDDSSVVENFNYLSEGTGGRSYTADSSADISEIVEEIIEVIPDIVKEPTLWQRIKAFFQKVFWFITFQWNKIWPNM